MTSIQNPSQSAQQQMAQRLRKSTAALFLGQAISHIVLVVRSIILARLLEVADFGLFGIALLMLTTLEAFSQTGLQSALIQKRDDIHDYLDTAWTLQVLRGLILSILSIALAPLVASWFGVPEVTLIIQVIGLKLLFRGLANIQITHLQRNIAFGRVTLYNLIIAFTDLVVAITLALSSAGVWALVWGVLTGEIVGLIASYVLKPYCPHFKLDWQRARELLDFGRWVAGSNLVVYLLFQGDDLIVGKMLGPVALSLYQMAYRFANLSVTQVAHVANQISFPMLARLQHNPHEMRRVYIQTLDLVLLCVLPLNVVLWVTAPSIIELLLGSAWLPAVPALQILTLFTAARTVLGTFSGLFQALGVPEELFRVSLIQLLVMALLICPFIWIFGLEGAAITVTLASFTGLIRAGQIIHRTMHIGLHEFLAGLRNAFIATFSVGTVLVPAGAMGNIPVSWLLASLCLLLVFGFIVLKRRSYILLGGS